MTLAGAEVALVLPLPDLVAAAALRLTPLVVFPLAAVQTSQT